MKSFQFRNAETFWIGGKTSLENEMNESLVQFSQAKIFIAFRFVFKI